FGVGEKVTSYRDALRHQRESMLRFIAAAIRNGVYFHDYGGGACHHGFCAAMTLEDADEALRRLGRAVGEMAGSYVSGWSAGCPAQKDRSTNQSPVNRAEDRTSPPLQPP